MSDHSAGDSADNIVPFGKYRGQPVAVMLADRPYCEWALAQPGIRERYPTFVTIVVGGGRSPNALTPEHNKLQLLFRDPVTRVEVSIGILDSDEIHNAAMWLWEHGALKDPRALYARPYGADRVEFEVDGWDVHLDWRGWLPCNFAIELKPQVGDDYPAILRTMKMRKPGGRRALIIDYFEAERATLDDVKWMFAQSRIVVKTTAEIRPYEDAVIESLACWKEFLDEKTA